MVALAPPENAPSDIDTEDGEEIAIHRTEDFSSSPCPSVDSKFQPNVRAKKTKKTLIVSYKWKKGQLYTYNKADIASDDHSLKK